MDTDEHRLEKETEFRRQESGERPASPELLTTDSSLLTPNPNWFQQGLNWLRRKKLERELRSSERFQKACEKIECFNLAASEELYQVEIRRKIESLRGSGREILPIQTFCDRERNNLPQESAANL